METFTVTTNSDDVDASDGVTSLREALALANASAAADKIVFAGNLAGSTIERQGQLVLSSDVTINGDTNKVGHGKGGRDSRADFAEPYGRQ